jgi:hypothetical protein
MTPFALVVKDLDAEAAGAPATKDLLSNGVAALDKAAGGDWLGLAPDKQFDIAKSMAGDPFFQRSAARPWFHSITTN